MKFNFQQFLIKITSRKFIAALGGIIASLTAVFALSDSATTQICGIIGAVLSALGYVFVEGYADTKAIETSAAVKSENAATNVIGGNDEPSAELNLGTAEDEANETYAVVPPADMPDE